MEDEVLYLWLQEPIKSVSSHHPERSVHRWTQQVVAGQERWGDTKLKNTYLSAEIHPKTMSCCDPENKQNLCFFRRESSHRTVGPTEPVSAGHPRSDIQGKIQPSDQHGQGFSSVQGPISLFKYSRIWWTDFPVASTQGSRPSALVVERTLDNGKTWQPALYMASDCRSAFPGIAMTMPRSLDQTYCYTLPPATTNPYLDQTVREGDTTLKTGENSHYILSLYHE